MCTRKTSIRDASPQPRFRETVSVHRARNLCVNLKRARKELAQWKSSRLSLLFVVMMPIIIIIIIIIMLHFKRFLGIFLIIFRTCHPCDVATAM